MVRRGEVAVPRPRLRMAAATLLLVTAGRPAGAQTTGAPAPEAARHGDEQPPTPRQEPASLGDDEVALVGGGMVRGTVVEVVPDDHVTIVVGGSDERRTIPWASVGDVQRGRHRQPVVDTRPAEESAERNVSQKVGPEPRPRRGAPRVHLSVRASARNRPDVALHEVTSTLIGTGPTGTVAGVEFRPVCTAPCDRVVDGSQGQAFFVSGPRVNPSRRFTLVDQGEATTVDVRPGHRALYVSGWLGTVVGLIGTATGAILLATAGGDDSLRTSGAVVLGVGAPVFAAGVVMLAFGHTRVTLVGSAAGARDRQ